MIDVKEAATRKIGPLPAIAWGGIIGGGILVFKFLRGDSGASSQFGEVVGGGNIDFEDGAGGGGNAAGGGSGSADNPDDGIVPGSIFPDRLLGPPTRLVPPISTGTLEDSGWRPVSGDTRGIIGGRRVIDPFGDRTVTVAGR